MPARSSFLLVRPPGAAAIMTVRSSPSLAARFRPYTPARFWRRAGGTVLAMQAGIKPTLARWASEDRETARAGIETWFRHLLAEISPRSRLDLSFFEEPMNFAASHRCRIEFRKGVLHLTISDNVFTCELIGLNVILRLVAVMPILGFMARRDGGLSGRFTLCLADATHGEDVAFCSNEPGCVLIPDALYLLSGGLSALRHDIAERWSPWEARDPVVFWRGSTTGAVLEPAALWRDDPSRGLPRLDLCARLSAGPLAPHCDVGISAIVQIEDPRLLAAATPLMRPFVPEIEQMRCRYHIVIDGNSSAWVRPIATSAMGSCLLMVGSPQGYRQWFYDRLEPWTNVVPIAPDLGDLEQVVEWVLTHDAEARRVAERGRALARQLAFGNVVHEAGRRLRRHFF